MAINDPIESMIECHDQIIARLSIFSRSLQAIEKHGLVGFVSEKEDMKVMFDFIDTSILPHERDEEDLLFPKLLPKLETKLSRHGAGDTPIDAIRKEHRMVAEVAARVKELAPLIERDFQSAEVSILLKEFLDKGRWLIQAYQRHIWKENNVLFPLAEQFLTAEEKQEIAGVIGEFRNQTVEM
jgi:hemerythrin-like domain-containing protein